MSENFGPTWRREAKVGIDSQGRFYTNALKDSSTSLYIGSIGAFGKDAKEDAYIGASFEVGDNSDTIFKVFMSMDDAENENQSGDIYIMGSPAKGDSNKRPMHLYGEPLVLNAGSCLNTKKEGTNQLKLEKGTFYAGTSKDYISLGSSISKVVTDLSLLLKSKDTELQLNNASTTLTSGTITLTSTNTTFTATGKTQSTIKGADSYIDLYSDYAIISCNKKEAYLELGPSTNASKLQSGGTLDITAPGTINIKSNPDANHQINIDAGTSYLHLIGGSKTATQYFILSSNSGYIRSAMGLVHSELKGKNRQYVMCNNDFRVLEYCAAKSFNFLTKQTSPKVVYNDSGATQTYSSTSV